MHASIGGIRNGAEGIYRLEIAVTHVAIGGAVEIVGTGAGDDVDHAPGGATIFRGVSIGDDLKFLNCLLRNRGPDAVHGVVDGVGAIYVDQVGAGALSAHVEAGGWGGADRRRVVTGESRISEREIDVVAAIDREIFNALLGDGVGGGCALGFYHLGFGTDGDGFGRAGHGERDGQLGHLTDGDRDILGFYLGETGGLYHDCIFAGRQVQQAVFAVSVDAGGAFKTLGLFVRGHGGIGDEAAFGVLHRDVEITTGGALGRGKSGQQQNRKSYRTEFRSGVHKSP